MELLVLIALIVIKCLLSPSNSKGGFNNIEKYKTFESFRKKWGYTYDWDYTCLIIFMDI